MKRHALILLALLAAASPASAQATVDEALALYSEGQFIEARAVAEPLAKDDPRAMTLLGTMFQKGQGVEVDWARARYWFGKAVEKNHADAEFPYAMLLLDARSGEVFVDEAAKLLAKAGLAGNVRARFNLGLIRAGRFGGTADFEAAAPEFKAAAEAGLAQAEYNYGLLLLDGTGVEKDLAAAAEWLSRAALQGMPEAALEYGVLVLRGDGVERDAEIGVKWLRYAADHGHPVAQNRLARLFASGLAKSDDPLEAAVWNMLAAKGGRPDATLDEYMALLSAAQRTEVEKRAEAFAPRTPPALD